LIQELRARIRKLHSQKDSLLKELGDLEDRLATSDQLYRTYLPQILDFLGEDRTSIAPQLKNLSAGLKKGSSLKRLELIFKEIRKGVLKENMIVAADSDDNKGDKKKKSFFKKLFTSPLGAFVEEYKKGYQEIINSLKENLDKKYIEQLSGISNRISVTSQANDFNSIRSDLFDIINSHMVDISSDHNKIASFVREIIQKIIELESMISATYNQAGDSVQSSEEFNHLLHREVGVMKDVVNVTESLDILKSKLNTTLTSIEVALKQKAEKDKAVKNVVEKNKALFMKGLIQLKKELNQAHENSKKLEVKLNHDPLTGAFNRRAYDKRMEDEMARFLRYGTIFSFILMDADKFSLVNNNYGHAVGDKCLQEIIKRTTSYIRKNDMLARYGGEEFVVILPETDIRAALVVAEKIRLTIEKIKFIYKKKTVTLTMSIGVSQVKDGDTTYRDVFNRADTAVYKAKETGRNRVVVSN